MKFYLKPSKTVTETLDFLHTTFGGNTLCQTTVYEWHRHFKRGQESIKDDNNFGRLSTS